MKADKIIVSIVIGVLLVLYTAVVFGFVTEIGEARLVELGLLATPLIILLLIFPRAALIVLAVQVFFVRWLYDYDILPREITYITDILIIIISGRALFVLPWRKNAIGRIEKHLFLMVGFAVLSTIINANSQTTFLVGMRLGFRYLFLFIAACHLDTSPKWLRNYLYLLIGIAILQIPVTLFQFSVYRWTDPDRMSGTFGRGQTGTLGMFLLFIIAYLMARMSELGRIRIRYIVLIALMSIAPIIGESKFYFLFVPFLIIFMMRREFYKRPVTAVVMAIAGILLVVGADSFIVSAGGWKEGNNPLSYIRRLPEVFQRELEVAQYGRFNRADRMLAATRLAAASPKNAILGEGPGAITSLALFPSHSPKASYYLTWGLTSESGMSVPWLLIEYGFLGLALFFFLLWLVYRRGRILRASDDAGDRIMGRTLEAIVLLYFLGMFYQASWQIDSISTIFWSLSALIVHRSFQIEAERKIRAAAIASESETSGQIAEPMPA